MDKVKICSLGSGVEGCYIHNTRFKTTRISINLFLPLNKDIAAANALLSCIMTRASKKYPDYTSLNAKLQELYGATLYGDVVKQGDMQLLKLVIASLDDKYTLSGESVLSECTELILSMLFNPPLEDGLFKSDDFVSEKRLLIERIESEINDKRRYAIQKTEKEMCSGEPFGIPKYGTVEDAAVLSNKDIVDALQYAIQNAFVRVNVIGRSDPDPIFKEIESCFSKVSRNVEKNNLTKYHSINEKVKFIEERMDVSQGKLCMGFSVNLGNSEYDKIVLRVFADLYGGGPYSRLFVNVREKQSLCYYCAARINSQKNILIVDSGVLEENRQKAYDGILEQLTVLQNGEFEESELEASKMALINSAKTVCDTASDIDGWYCSRVFDESPLTTEEFAEYVSKVTKDDIIKVANAVKLDTVYFLGSQAAEQ